MMYGWGGALGALWMLLFWAGVVALIVWAVRSSGSWSGKTGTRSRAIEILEERFARGEIDREEFNLRRDELGRS